MEKTKLNKEDKKVVIIALAIGFIAQFFIKSSMDIAVLGLCMYLFHKYISTTENIKEYDSYEFSDKAKFDRGRKLFVYVVDIYIVIKIIFILFNPQSSYTFGEILLILIIYSYYEKYLNKKYVISTNILEEEKKVVFARKKLLLTIGMIIFIGFTVFSINTFKNISTQSHVKYGKYEYSISGTYGSRKIEAHKLGSDYMKANENDKNSMYFDTFEKDIKSLMKKQVIKSYTFIGVIIGLIFCVIENYPKDDKIVSKATPIIIIGVCIFMAISFNIDVDKDKMDLVEYYHEYMTK